MTSESAPSAELLSEYLLRLGDDALVLGHRLSQWCTRGPTLEEDLAFANIALDYLGQAQLVLAQAAELLGGSLSADRLAYFREAVDYRNLLLVELPCTSDFGLALMRQFLFDAYRYELLQSQLQSRSKFIAGFSEKALKESRYHLRHSSSWIVRLGDGTVESKQRLTRALEQLWPYLPELFQDDPVDVQLCAAQYCPLPSSLRAPWLEVVETVFQEATLIVPELPTQTFIGSGRKGQHTEHLGHMLAEMQILARSFPDAAW